MTDLCGPQRHHHLGYTGPLLQVRGKEKIRGQGSNAIKPDGKKTDRKLCQKQSESASSLHIPSLNICRVTVLNESLYIFGGFSYCCHFNHAILEFSLVMPQRNNKRDTCNSISPARMSESFFLIITAHIIEFAEVEFEKQKHKFNNKIEEMKIASEL